VASLAGYSCRETQLYPSVEDRPRLGHLAASRPRAEGTVPMPNLVGHGSVNFGSS
jgi:hypothetical protein